MTLSEMADFVCTKVRQTDDASVAACKTYLKQRLKMAWDDQLWRQSIMVIPTVHYRTDGILIVPQAMDLVLGITIGPDIPVANDGAGFSTEFHRHSVMEQSSFEQWMGESIDAFFEQGRPLQYALMAPAVYTVDQQYYDEAPGGVFTATDSDGVEHFVRYLAPGPTGQYHVMYEKEVTISGTTTLSNGAFEILAWSRSDSSAGAILYFNGAIVASMPVGTDNYKPALRVRLNNRLASTANPLMVRILAKMQAPTWSFDAEECPLRNASNCLISFAQGDMLQRERQYQKAQLCYQEGAALLEQLKRIETVQQANRQRLIPSDGIGYQEYYNTWLTKA